MNFGYFSIGLFLLTFPKGVRNYQKFWKFSKKRRDFFYLVRKYKKFTIFLIISITSLLFIFNIVLFICSLVLFLILKIKLIDYKNSKIETKELKNIIEFLELTLIIADNYESFLDILENAIGEHSDKRFENFEKYLLFKKLGYQNLTLLELNSLEGEIIKFWELSIISGISIKKTNSILLKTYLEEIEMINELNIEISATKTSANILVMMPLLGLFFAQILGSNIFNFFIFQNIGNYAMLTGLVFILIGIIWVNKIIKKGAINA